MIDIENGRYWDEGIELISGCTPCSPGCEHCWSVANTRRFHPGFVDDGHFNGRIHIHRESLKRFNTRSPKVFAIWNDLFHEFVPDQFVSEVYGTIPDKPTPPPPPPPAVWKYQTNTDGSKDHAEKTALDVLKSERDTLLARLGKIDRAIEALTA